MKIPVITTLLALVFTPLQSQSFQRINAPVVHDGTEILSPWTGGVSAPQWSKVDLNGDGKMDLYEFDRDGFIHVPFLNVGDAGESKYVYAPQFAPNFPIVWNYVLLRDYNNDGAMDFFGHANNEGIPGFKVFNGSFENNQLVFEREEFPHWIFDVITIPTSNGGYTNLQVANVNYPAIDDIDGDGDLDILELDLNSGFRIVYYKNLALEQGFTTDTLIFTREDDCWLRLFIPTSTTMFNLSGDPDTCATGLFAPEETESEKNGGLHGASTLCTFDADNDGDMEVLYGDLNFPQVMYAFNNGTPDQGWATEQDVTFPSYNVPIDMPDFPATFYLDFDNDGLRDLLVSPNEFNVSPDQEVWFYKNINSNETPQFNLTSKFAIVDNMIDLGTGAQPAFFDYNADGLMDFVVGSFETKQTTATSRESSLHLYENTGTATDPKFELVDDDWLNFRQFSLLPDQNKRFAFAPTFGDIDQDGDQDLLVGEEKGFLFFIENIAAPNNPPEWGPVIPQWKGIDVGVYSTPCIFDINKDGLEDLIIGERNGNINFFPNQGDLGSPDFHDDPDEAPNNKRLGFITTIQQGTTNGFSSPLILDFMDTVYLVSGSESGFIEVYEVDENKLEEGDTFNLVTKQFGDLRLGTHSRIAFANVNDDDILDALVGNHRGGLGLFSSPFNLGGSVDATEAIVDLEFNVFPNPANDYLKVSFENGIFGQASYRIYNTLGQISKKGFLSNGDDKIDIALINTGIYFIEIKRGDRVGVQKVFIQK